MVPERDWFADEISDLGSKDRAQDLCAKWIIELAELSALKRGDIERVKAFMSRSVDHYRPSYGRRSQDFPRQCVFAGTTNADAYLADETGNRRFWPVRVGAIDLAALERNRDQLWAEAVVAYRAGETWWLDRGLEQAAALQQGERRISDPWEPRLRDWLGSLPPDRPVRVHDALERALHVAADKQDQAGANRVARVLKLLGWRRVQQRAGKVREWVYLSPVEDGLSPVGNGHTGDKNIPDPLKLNDGVTSVTSVTSRSLAHGDTTTYPPIVH